MAAGVVSLRNPHGLNGSSVRGGGRNQITLKYNVQKERWGSCVERDGGKEEGGGGEGVQRPTKKNPTHPNDNGL